MTHPKEEKTLVLIKPDGVQRSLIGEIVRRYERSGLKLVGLKMTVPTKELVEKHYLVDPEWRVKTGKKTIESYLKKYMVKGPVIAMVWQGMHSVGIVRKITGGTEPLTSDVGTIRGDLTIDSYEVADIDTRAVRNLIHASGSTDDAEKEIALWFGKDELIKYKLVGEAILYDINLDGILE